LIYTLLCDDVRLEMGNKISLMGVFQNIMVEKLPVSLIKFAVVNHWQGEGVHQTEVRILSSDRNTLIVTSQPTRIELAAGGFTDNVSFFVNVMFQTAGTYWVQTIANSVLLEELPLIVTDAGMIVGVQPPEEFSETVN
jgi:protein associated with RNAse G/E